jgi:hypothetical protein
VTDPGYTPRPGDLVFYRHGGPRLRLIVSARPANDQEWLVCMIDVWSGGFRLYREEYANMMVNELRGFESWLGFELVARA